MNRRLLVLCFTVACTAPGDFASTAPSTPRFASGAGAETDLYERRLWDDGNAEVAIYAARERRYGTLRDSRAVLITVKEDLDTSSLVKADGPYHPHTVEVIKLNTLVTTVTGVYEYRQMSSTWLARRGAHPIRVTLSSQDWCGLTHKTLTVLEGAALLRTDSYFGAEAGRVFRFAVDERTVLGDALPLFVRTLDLRSPGVRRLRIADAQLSSHAPPPRVRDATFEVGLPGVVDVPAGRFGAVPITVLAGDDEDVYWVDAEAPHTLVRWDRADGGTWELDHVRRAPYWAMHDLEHEGALDAEPVVPDLPEVPDLSAEPPAAPPAD
jgi:hypothetical protein